MLLQIHNQDFALVENDRQRVIENLTELHDKVLDTMAPNTKKAYLTDFNEYLAFCREHNMPSLASEWRVTKTSIETFFNSLMTGTYARYNAKDKSKTTPYKLHTIKRKLASIRFFIGIAELPDPFKHSKLFQTYVSNSLKSKPKKQRQAPAMTQEIVELISSIAKDDSLIMLRDITILNVGFDSLFRASNLVAISVDDIDFASSTVFTQYSKTDKTGEGHYGYLSDTSLALIKNWKTRAGIEEGYLFRRLSPKQTIQKGHISSRSLWDIYKRLGSFVDEDINWSCHSTRTGGVLSMVENNVPMLEIMKHGPWKSSAMPGRYSEQYTVAKTGMGKVR